MHVEPATGRLRDRDNKYDELNHIWLELHRDITRPCRRVLVHEDVTPPVRVLSSFVPGVLALGRMNRSNAPVHELPSRKAGPTNVCLNHKKREPTPPTNNSSAGSFIRTANSRNALALNSSRTVPHCQKGKAGGTIQ